MNSQTRRQFLEEGFRFGVKVGVVLGTGSFVNSSPAWAAPSLVGGETTLGASISGEERAEQPDIWALEIHFKPVRMVRVDLPDLKTGQVAPRLIWYLCYRTIYREIPGIKTLEFPDADRPLFVPEFTLVTNDNGKQKVYVDRVIPAVQAVVNKREKKNYKNSVEIVAPLPPVSAHDAKPGSETSLDGVAMWRGVDPKTDFFKVYMSGFSNGYKRLKTPDGMENVQRKTIVQSYWRPSDEFDQNENEIRPDPKDSEPKWIYR